LYNSIREEGFLTRGFTAVHLPGLLNWLFLDGRPEHYGRLSKSGRKRGLNLGRGVRVPRIGKRPPDEDFEVATGIYVPITLRKGSIRRGFRKGKALYRIDLRTGIYEIVKISGVVRTDPYTQRPIRNERFEEFLRERGFRRRG